jgi:hypothetical protein
LVPDTLDLQTRAGLGVHSITGPTDPLADFEMYFYVHLFHSPPMMQHTVDSHCQSKFLESLPLMRLIHAPSEGRVGLPSEEIECHIEQRLEGSF